MTDKLPVVTRIGHRHNAARAIPLKPSFRPLGLRGHQYVMPTFRRANFRRFTIAFGPSPEERDEMPGVLWRALVLLLAHDVLWGAERPGVRVRWRDGRGRVRPEFGLEVEPAADAEPFAITPWVARQLNEAWGFLRIVDVAEGDGVRSFFAPTSLARLALAHTPELVEFVQECVNDARAALARSKRRVA